jgi:hypothetical protein
VPRDVKKKPGNQKSRRFFTKFIFSKVGPSLWHYSDNNFYKNFSFGLLTDLFVLTFIDKWGGHKIHRVFQEK